MEEQEEKPKRRRRIFLIFGLFFALAFTCFIALAIGLFVYEQNFGELSIENPAGEFDPAQAAQFDPADPPRFLPADCPARMPAGATVECGTVYVPKDWTNPKAGEAVALAVAVFRAETDSPAADPVIYLDGGPGGFTLEVLQYSFEETVQPFLADRDYITYDQRGIGYSQPALSCPNLKEFELSLLDSRADWDELKPRYYAEISACSERLAAERIDLSAYGSNQSAADVDAIRQALGYDQWNLFGVSYGTRLAQTVMRDYPEGVRSVILDSAYPIEADLFENIPRSMRDSFQVFFDSCASDASCSQLYPDLEARFYSLVDQLNENPVEIEITHLLNGSSYDALFWGDDLVNLLFQTLYSETMFVQMPDMIEDLEQGELDDVTQMEELFFINDDFFSGAIYTTIQCREEYPFSDPADALDEIEANPKLASYFEDYEDGLEQCDFWGAGEAGTVENEPVASTIPTLILAGGFDPVTPPWWGQSLQANLENSYFVEVAPLAHGVFAANECTNQIGLDFLDEPTVRPDTACTADIASPIFEEPD